MAPPPSPPAPLCTASGTDGVVGNGREGGRAGVKEGGAVAAFAFSATRSPSALPPIGGFVDVAPEATACRSSSSLCSAASLEAEEETEAVAACPTPVERAPRRKRAMTRSSRRIAVGPSPCTRVQWLVGRPRGETYPCYCTGCRVGVFLYINFYRVLQYVI